MNADSRGSGKAKVTADKTVMTLIRNRDIGEPRDRDIENKIFETRRNGGSGEDQVIARDRVILKANG